MKKDPKVVHLKLCPVCRLKLNIKEFVKIGHILRYCKKCFKDR